MSDMIEHMVNKGAFISQKVFTRLSQLNQIPILRK